MVKTFHNNSIKQIQKLSEIDADFSDFIKKRVDSSSNGSESASTIQVLTARSINTLQINITRKCNQVCTHCHVDAGPSRKEEMNDAVIDKIIDLLSDPRIKTLDITGGAPEMHSRFEDLITYASQKNKHVIHRCNLTAIDSKRYRHLPEKFAKLGIEIVASLPHYKQGKTDFQRGDGVFEKSIRSLHRLNELGYAREDNNLQLNLVTNPVGALLPGDQASLEKMWKKKLAQDFGISFNNLYTITNMPISRYLDFLVNSNQFDEYMSTLVNAFNPSAVPDVMCRDMISIGYDGGIYDCDFNQMLELPIQNTSSKNILGIDLDELVGREIVVANHCFGCTAGNGSSCGGQVS